MLSVHYYYVSFSLFLFYIYSYLILTKKNKSCQELIKDVKLAKENYKPVSTEMSTPKILESLRLERIEDPNYYDYASEGNEKCESIVVEKSEVEITKENLNDIESSDSEAFMSCHERVCQKSLSEIKESLPRYNPSLSKEMYGKKFIREKNTS